MNWSNLNVPDAGERLKALTEMMSSTEFPPANGADVNNHIHTIFSFSPYSPTAAVYLAKMSGLSTAGIMDHDSVAGLREFAEAGRIAGLPTTGGAEVRVSFLNTPFADRRINNTDQDGNAYITLHGIPLDALDEVDAFLAPLRARRNVRNRAMVERINAWLASKGVTLTLHFDQDVLPLSQSAQGGSVTERHLLFALSNKLINRYGKGEALVNLLINTLGLDVSSKVQGWLKDAENPHYGYDLLGVLKSDVSMFYIDATDECADVRDILALSERVGAISAYAYLGDVGDSVTGDKRTQCFEDAYLDELFAYLKELGFRAVTYMPPRNTIEQLRRVRALCDKHGFFQISGVDINSSRQEFVCKELRNPEFANLVDAAWALIGHESQSLIDRELGFFGSDTIQKYPDLAQRTTAFRKIAEGK